MMNGGWDYGTSSWYGMIFGPIMMIAFIVVTVLIIAWVLRSLGFGWQSSTQGETPLDTLKHRFARGEINRAEYEERRQLLSDL
jgi:putative membrane protein